MVIFIVVFAIAATVVWWRVLTNDGKHGKQPAACASSSKISGLTAHDVQVRVYNATEKEGLAAGGQQAAASARPGGAGHRQ